MLREWGRSMTRMLPLMPGGRIPLGIEDVDEVELLEMVGSGGYGMVWKVADTRTREIRALKVIQGIKEGSVTERRARLEATVRIPSKYIVQTLGICEWDPHTFLILSEYAQGKTLEDLIREASLSPAEKSAVLKQVLLGTRDAHRANLIHRDLKPANVIYRDGQVKLIDFGVSKFKGKDLTITGDVIGTPPYMDPQLLLKGAKVADARTDIYSIGQMFYELATGQTYWTRKGWKELSDLVDFLTQVPPPTEVVDFDGFRCEFHANAERIIRRMVKLNPADRYTTVDEALTEMGWADTIGPVDLPPDLALRSPVLIVESGSNRGARTVLGMNEGEERELGRLDLAGADTSISRLHLAVRRTGDHYVVRDLGSKNGTLVAGVAVDSSGPPRHLNHGDRIKVGDIFLRFAYLHKT